MNGIFGFDEFYRTIIKLAEFLKQNKNARRKYGFFIIPFTIFFLGLYIASDVYFQKFQDLKNISGIGLVVSIVALLPFIISFLPIKAKDELEEIKEERKEIKSRLRKTSENAESKEDVLDVVQLNLNQVTEYYTINKSQASKSFSVGVLAISLGFIVICTGIILCMINKTQINIVFITSASGIILEFIGLAYFYMYNKSIKQLNYFYNELMNTQDIMLATKLCESIDAEKKDVIKEKIIDSLIIKSDRNCAIRNELILNNEHDKISINSKTK